MGTPRILFALIVCVLALTGSVAGAQAATPRCYGAASRDPLRPCVNPRLTLRVTPTPEDALQIPNSPCDRLEKQDVVWPCTFGVPEQDAKHTVALIGDSHASAWRAALQPIALERKWRGISITHTSCAFSRFVAR